LRRYGGGLSLRELVESFAEQNDVPFMPKPGRTHAGMQVYSFGGVSVVIDAAREEMLAQRLDGDRGWVPASIEQLLEMHAARKGLRAGK
jgi:tuftelin-interacting protein 11